MAQHRYHSLGVVLWWWAGRRRRLARVAAITVPIGLLIGYSRAYLSIHWLSDVAAGLLVAILATALVVFVDRRVATRIRSTNKAPRHRPTPIYVVSLLTVITAAVLAVTGRHNFPTKAPTSAPTRLATTQPKTLLRVLPHYSETLFGRAWNPSAWSSSPPKQTSALRSSKQAGRTLGTNAAGDPFFTDGNVAVLRQPSCR